VICGSQTVFTKPAIVNVLTLSRAPGLNYLRTREILSPDYTDPNALNQSSDINTVKTTTQYFDGLGRPVQTVAQQNSPSGNDNVTLTTYDDFGREIIHYLPFSSSSSDGNFNTQPITDTNNFNKILYPSENFLHGKTDYEPSPLNRPINNYAPGNSWVGSSRGVGQHFFTYDNSSGLVSMASGSGYYGAGKLTIKKTTDEHQNELIEYVDKEGHTVCKKVQSGGTDPQGNKLYASTYYIYDDLGNLVVVLPPEAIRSALAAINQH
jgi:hypothetical protein